MRRCVFVCLVALHVATCGALFEDQLGNYDWYRRGVGLPIQAALHSQKPRLLVATDADVLAHLHLRDGAILWRQKLDHRVAELHISQSDLAVVTLTTDGVVRCWSQTEGTIRWERPLGDAVRAWKFLDGEGPKFLYLLDDAVELRNVADGLIWSRRVDPVAGCQGRHVFSAGAPQMTLISQCTGGKVLLTSFDLERGTDFFTREYFLDGYLFGQAAIVQDHLVLEREAELCTADLMDGSKTMTCHITTGSHTFFQKRMLEIDPAKGQAQIQSPDQSSFQTVPHYALHSLALRTTDLEAVAFLQHHSSGWSVEVFDMLTGMSLHTEDVPSLPEDFLPEGIALGSYLRKNATLGYRFLVVGSFGEVLMLQQSQVVWEREEAIAGVRTGLFVDPPTHGSHHIQTDPIKWLQSQFLTLKVQFSLDGVGEKERLAQLRQDLSGKSLAVKDASGYRKFILVLTKYCSVMALHNGDGRILWHTKFPPSYQFEGMELWSYAHSEDDAPQVLLYRKGPDAAYAILDAHSGKLLLHERTPIDFTKILQLPHPLKHGTTDQSLFLLVDGREPDSPVGCLLPAIQATEALDNVVVWDVDREAGVAQGFQIQTADLPSNRLTFRPQWRLDFHAPIVSVSHRGFQDPVHSYTKVLGDRSLLFKYLNPNTALIVTAEGGIEFDDAFLEAFVIDTITGRILFRQLHASAKGPVHSVISQHWAVYHYWSISNQRFQMSALELYDASHRPLTVSDLVLGQLEEEKLSSYDPIPIKVFNATFFFSTAVTSLMVTKTQKGITTQQLLMATVTDQIYAMNKKFLDPRRPIRPTQESKDERLLPYAEQLPLIPSHFASHHYDIQSLRGFVATPAGLESGAHLFAFGEDLYYTRLQPERGFDTLDEDFNYAFLLLTLSAMFVASVICHFLVRDAKLARKWR